MTWDNAAGGLWQLDANWDTLSQPNAGTDGVVILNPAGGGLPVVVTVGPSLTRTTGTLTIQDSGGALANQLIVANNTFLVVNGDITNDGTISLASTGNVTRLRLGTDLTLSGAGEVVLGGATDIIDDAGGPKNILTQASGHTIRGAGNIGANSLGMINQLGALVSSDVNGGTLILDPGLTNGFTNQGTYEAVNGGTLLLTGSAGGSFTNTGAVIKADGADTFVDFTASSAVNGGTVRGVNGGTVRNLVSQNVLFTDVTFQGNIESLNNSDFGIAGSITNQGTISLKSTGNATDLELQTDVTLNGGGTVLLDATDGTLNRINAATNGLILTNVDNTIRGAGDIGGNLIGLVNQADVIADVSGQTLTLDPSGIAAANGFINQGTFAASNGATLVLTGNAGGSFENQSGGLIDIDAGSTLNLTGTLTHRQGASIDQAGVFNINSGGNFINQADDYSPGASPGIVNVNNGGTFTNDTNGTVTFEINADGTPGVNFDTIRGGGTFNLAGTLDLELNFTPNFYESIQLIVDTSSGNVNGRFEQLAFDPIVAPGDALAITYETDAVLLTRALPGDANLDGFISQSDLDAVLLNWGSTTSTWQTGEFTGDDFVSQADLDIVLLNWGDGTPPVLTIPEPTTLSLGMLSLLVFAKRRRQD